jgi:hypothetical protein
MRPFHREVTAWLRDYGATDVRLVAGGKHPRFEFRFAGRSHRFVVPGTPGDHRDAVNTIAMIRRTLGAPLQRAPRTRRTMEEMMSETIAKVNFSPTADLPQAEILTGGMALYAAPRGKFRVRFFLPEKIAAGWESSVLITRQARNVWELRSSPAAGLPGVRRNGGVYQVDGGYADLLTAGFTEPFGVSPAEYTQTDGVMSVRLLLDSLRPVKIHRKRQKPATSDAVEQVQQLLAPELRGIMHVPSICDDAREYPDQDILPTAAATEDEVRGCLETLRRIEATTAWRLVRRKPAEGAEPGAWSFVQRIE